VLFVFVTGRLCFIARDISRKESLLLAQIRFNFKPQENVLTVKKQREKTASLKVIVLIILLFVLCHMEGNYRCFCFVFKLCVAFANLKEVIHVLHELGGEPLVYAVLKKDTENGLKKIAPDRRCHC